MVISDEQPARERLRQLLTAHPDVEVVGEAEDGRRRERIAELTPISCCSIFKCPAPAALMWRRRWAGRGRR